ncbi:MAG: aldo/keto reductase [Gammaproteobacteria bacterium]
METPPTVTLPAGETVPALGQGTWQMGETARGRGEELAALRAGLDLGMTLLDTAEMYGSGAAEELIAEAVAGRRDEVFIVSKVYPHNAGRKGAVEACERSLRRLDTDRIDLYLLHWRGSVPLAETVEAFEKLKQAGKIRHWGVSNFDRDDMEELLALSGGDNVATNQILYNLERREAECDLLPWCDQRHIPIMAYSPLEHPVGGRGRLLKNKTLRAVAERHDATPAQIALAWLLRRPQCMVIPKAGSVEHVRENHAALEIKLGDRDLTDLDQAFPLPKGKRRLVIR